MTLNFNMSLPPQPDNEALNLLLNNLDEELCVQIDFEFAATSGSASAESNLTHWEWKLPPLIGVKIKSLEATIGPNTILREVYWWLNISKDLVVELDAPHSLNQLLFVREWYPVTATTRKTSEYRKDKGLGVKLDKNQLDVRCYLAFTDTVTASCTLNASITINYQLFKRSETEYAQLVADTVQ